MIYTIRFWREGQWNFIPDKATEDLYTAVACIDKYELSDYQIMESEDKLVWKVYEDDFKEP
jgi:hypothetical protein